MKLKYIKSILQSRSSLLPSYCSCGYFSQNNVAFLLAEMVAKFKFTISLGWLFWSTCEWDDLTMFSVACTRLYNPLCPSVGRSDTICFFGIYWRFWGYCSCPTAWLVYFITAPANPHATRVAVYPALLFSDCNNEFFFSVLHILWVK